MPINRKIIQNQYPNLNSLLKNNFERLFIALGEAFKSGNCYVLYLCRCINSYKYARKFTQGFLRVLFFSAITNK